MRIVLPSIAVPPTPEAVKSALNEVVMKPIAHELILSHQVFDALKKPDPVEELYFVREQFRFGYNIAQRAFFSAFLNEERRAFTQFKESGEVHPEFAGCLMHRGQLFVNCPPERLTPELRAEWGKLLSEQLEYALSHDVWDPALKALVAHSQNALTAICLDWDQRPVESDNQLESILGQYLRSPQLRALLDEPDDIGNVVLLIGAIDSARLSGYSSVCEEIVGLLPSFYGRFFSLFPEYYFAPPSPESRYSPDTVNGDQHASEDELDESIDDDDSELDALFDAWGEVVRRAVLVALITPEAPHRPALFLDIVRSSSFLMVGYEDALYGLASVSQQGLQQFLPELILRACEDPYGIAGIITLVSLNEYLLEPLEYDPRDLVIRELRKLPVRDRNRLLLKGRELIEADTNLFEDADAALEVLASIEEELRRPQKRSPWLGNPWESFD